MVKSACVACEVILLVKRCVSMCYISFYVSAQSFL
jgi:hypothetical protein